MTKQSNSIKAYFKDSFEELRKVTWPTNEQAVRLTIITLVFSMFVALFFGLLDYVFSLGFTELIDLF
jgi:preprotein translocase subunit SecE